jgi:hypothetical protein
MTDIKKAYGTSTALTITLASLAHSDNAGRESTAADNGTNKFLDALVQVVVKLAAGTPSADRTVYVYAYGSEDGTIFTDNATGTDAAITLTDPPNVKLIGTIRCPAAGALTYESQPMSVAKAFDWIMPRKWGIIVRNNTNVALDTTGSAAKYTGIYYTNV